MLNNIVYAIDLSDRSYLRVPSSLKAPETKRRLQLALLNGSVIPAIDEEDIAILKANNADGLLVSSGKMLVNNDVLSNPLELIKLYEHEHTEAIMQIIQDKDIHVHQAMKELLINNSIIQSYNLEDIQNLPLDLQVNHIIARAFELIFILNEGLAIDKDLTKEEKLFLSKISPIINANKHSYFTDIFFDPAARENKIKSALENGMVFYQVARHSTFEETGRNDHKYTKTLLSKIVIKPVGFDWEANKKDLPDLNNRFLGYTTENGIINFSPIPNFPLSFHAGMVGKRRATIIDSMVKNGVFGFTVEFTKENGEDPIKKTFQVGNVPRVLQGGNNEKGNTGEVLEISDKLGLLALKDFIKEPKEFKEKIKSLDLKGYRIGPVDITGRVTFSPFENYPCTLKILGKAEEGWEAYIVDNEVKDDIFEFTVELTKENEKPVIRKFQIGEFTRPLEYAGEKEGRPDREVLEISDKLGSFALAKIIGRPEDFEKDIKTFDLSSLIGTRIGVTDKKGRISIKVKENYFYPFYILGKEEEGWEAYIVDSLEKSGVIEFNVRLVKDDKIVIKTFQISKYTCDIQGSHAESGNTISVLEIGSELGVNKLIELMNKPPDFYKKANKNDLPDLRGLKLRDTVQNGCIDITVFKGFNVFHFPVLGAREKGWESYIIDNDFKDGVFEFTVRLTKKDKANKGKKPDIVIRRFQIGKTRKTLSKRGDTEKKEELFSIDFLEEITNPGQEYLINDKSEILDLYDAIQDIQLLAKDKIANEEKIKRLLLGIKRDNEQLFNKSQINEILKTKLSKKLPILLYLANYKIRGEDTYQFKGSHIARIMLSSKSLKDIKDSID
ncbi:MAG: hypothetical protein ABIG92_04855, partial [Candidatus Omnitrophota bacterium]